MATKRIRPRQDLARVVGEPRAYELSPTDQRPVPLRPITPLREPDHLDTTIYALLRHLPPPGAVWPETERQKWLETMHQTFTLVYRDASET